MGGDEFAVWESCSADYDAVEKQFLRLLKECSVLSERLHVSVSCSAGIAGSRRTGEDFTALYNRADKDAVPCEGAGERRCLPGRGI